MNGFPSKLPYADLIYSIELMELFQRWAVELGPNLCEITLNKDNGIIIDDVFTC